MFVAKSSPEPLCETKVDVGFVLDSSGSLRKEYGKEKSFLKALAATFGVSGDGARAGVVTFSHDVEHSIKLNEHTNLATFNQAVDDIALMGSTTRIDKALRTSQNEMFSVANGGRPGVNKLLIVLTDGSQTQGADAEDPGLVADELRKEGIRILVVGIGSAINSTELAHIAGGKSNLFSASSFDALISRDFLKDLNTAGCTLGKYCVCFADSSPLPCLS